MNNSISNPAISNNTWKRIKAQYVATACGLALVVTAVATLSGDLAGQSTGQTTTTAGRPAATVYNASAQSAPQVAFYLVASEAQAAKVQQYEELAQWVRLDNGVAEPNRSVVVLSAASSEDETRARALIDDAMAAANFTSEQAPAFEIVDMRNY